MKSRELNREKGILGERVATEYLIKNGAEILEKNYKNNFGEIDIIANMDEKLVFVEVKSRTNLHFGYPAEAVDLKKRHKIIKIAKYYISEHNYMDMPVRFDVIEVFLADTKLRHIINAF
ncbi:MAG: YraN family protein [Clostridioides sp.]|jgi:putative endonuclease|nr:YraN family protein [Clostridioides sp.]